MFPGLYHLRACLPFYRINKKVLSAGRERRAMILQEYLDEVEWKWSDPINSYTKESVIQADTKTVDEDNVLGSIYKKLKIVIPKVRFENRDLDFVVSFIKRTTRDLDEDGEGLNVIVSVDEAAADADPGLGGPDPVVEDDALGGFDDPDAGLGDPEAGPEAAEAEGERQSY